MSEDRLWKKGGSRGVCQLRPDAVPAELAALPHWVVWYWDFRYNANGERKMTKIPMDPKTRQDARTNDPETWGTFPEAVECHTRMGNGGGVGFVFTSLDPYCGIDLDKCRNAETGELSPRAKAILARFPTYAEVSPSGTGVKLLMRAVMPQGRNRKDGIEIYDRGRFFTVTGDVVADQPIDVADCGAELASLHAELFPVGVETEVQPVIAKAVDVDDDKLIAVIRRSKNAEKFNRLWAGDTTGYESGSEADLALVNYLIGYTGGDYDRADNLFRQSGLYRDKWERKDYRVATMDTAMSNRTWFYDPDWGKQQKQTVATVEEEVVSGATVSPSDVATLKDLKEAGAELRFLWPGWIQHAVVNIIAAEGGTGKTRFVADIIRRIRHSQPWPDGAANQTSPEFRSLWVLADNHHAEMVDVGEKFGIMDSVWVSAYKANPFDGTMLESLEDWKSLGAIIRAVRPHMLVVDTVGNSTSKNLSRQEDAMEYYRPLQVIARKYDLPVLCLTHLAAGGNVLGRRGQEKVRVVIKMDKPDPDDERRRVFVLKSNQLKPKELGVSMSDGGADYDDKPPQPPEEEDPFGTGKPKRGRGRPGGKLPLCEAWLRDLLRHGAVPSGQLSKSAERGGFAKSTLYKALENIGAEKVDQGGEEWWKWDES